MSASGTQPGRGGIPSRARDIPQRNSRVIDAAFIKKDKREMLLSAVVNHRILFVLDGSKRAWQNGRLGLKTDTFGVPAKTAETGKNGLSCKANSAGRRDGISR
jgi:hypothetical protein